MMILPQEGINHDLVREMVPSLALLLVHRTGGTNNFGWCCRTPGWHVKRSNTSKPTRRTRWLLLIRPKNLLDHAPMTSGRPSYSLVTLPSLLRRGQKQSTRKICSIILQFSTVNEITTNLVKFVVVQCHAQIYGRIAMVVLLRTDFGYRHHANIIPYT